MQIQEHIKALRHWPLCGEFTGDRWIPRTKGSNAENVSIWWRHHSAMAWCCQATSHSLCQCSRSMSPYGDTRPHELMYNIYQMFPIANVIYMLLPSFCVWAFLPASIYWCNISTGANWMRNIHTFNVCFRLIHYGESRNAKWLFDDFDFNIGMNLGGKSALGHQDI